MRTVMIEIVTSSSINVKAGRGEDGMGIHGIRVIELPCGVHQWGDVLLRREISVKRNFSLHCRISLVPAKI